MRAFTRLVFDDYVAGTNAVFTSDANSELLGQCGKLAIQVVCSNVSGSGLTLTVRMQTSVDGRVWSYKSATPEINGRGLTAGSTSTEVGADGGQTPSLGRVRLSVALSGTTPGAQIRVWVTGRRSGSAGAWARTGALFPELAGETAPYGPPAFAPPTRLPTPRLPSAPHPTLNDTPTSLTNAGRAPASRGR